MTRFAWAAAAALLPVAAMAAGVSTTAALLARVPPVPHDAAGAYAQWVDNRGDLTQGPGYKALEADIQATAMAPILRQEAPANAIMKKYETPQGQQELKNMSMEQKMALAQQMQQAQMAQMGGGASVVSENDGALLRKLQPNPGIVQIRVKMGDIAVRLGQIEQQWQAEDAKLAQAELAAMSKLPICKSEAGEPSELSIKGVKLEFADKHMALAPGFLPKYQALANEKRALIAQEAKSADDALAAWQHLQSPALRGQMQALVVGQISNAAVDAGAVLNIVEAGSKRAAQTMAQKRMLEAEYKDAKGC